MTMMADQLHHGERDLVKTCRSGRSRTDRVRKPTTAMTVGAEEGDQHPGNDSRRRWRSSSLGPDATSAQAQQPLPTLQRLRAMARVDMLTIASAGIATMYGYPAQLMQLSRRARGDCDHECC
jgi:hypothetical protein